MIDRNTFAAAVAELAGVLKTATVGANQPVEVALAASVKTAIDLHAATVDGQAAAFRAFVVCTAAAIEAEPALAVALARDLDRLRTAILAATVTAPAGALLN
ncbi:hypothetical protein FBZ89_104396 [Nitrospirillum amazonense]|uniref:Uncharacterized protein n=1 Tax=Nitrospirillum amazonense TaxID=28077 RepID=A0A560FKK9_9PROT|nr:hypothetical protein [Nitrospirillum amazonense]TWB22146.1 hypothetical protein FBZ89_104396 [Nitrospirillum amazonense]